MIELDRQLDALLLTAAAERVVPGVVAVVADRHSVLYAGAFGRRDARTGAAMTRDTIFRIASMTKLVTAISLLQLVERGLVALATPVGDVLPAFDDLPVLDGFDADTPRLRRPATRATILQLLTHTSGLGYDIWNADLVRFHALTGMARVQTGLRVSFGAPLVADPGTRFSYGTSMDWVGLVVEALSGRPLEAYWREQLFEPLGMTDTVVRLDPDRRARSSLVHVRGDGGDWQPTAIDFVQQPEFYAGGHCLYSTAADFLRLQQALLRDGESAAGRLLAPATVAAMFRDHLVGLDVGTIVTADPAASLDVPLSGKKWGLGILVEPEDVPGGRAAGSGGWAGGFNTFFWVDRSRNLTAALYTQTLPFYADPIVDLYRRFETAVYGSAPAAIRRTGAPPGP